MTRYPTFTFKGQNSNDFGLLVRKLPVMAAPEARFTETVIPGRDGFLTVMDGGFAGDDVKIECVMRDPARRFDIMGWLTGSGDLISSEMPTYRRKARVSARIEPLRMRSGESTFVVSFRCQPFLYEATPSVVSLTATGSISNIGAYKSLPKLDVYGAGTVTIGGVTLTVTATGGEAYVTIDSEMQECYFNTASRNGKVSGGFPTLQVGQSTVTLGAGITRVDITGNWRWY